MIRNRGLRVVWLLIFSIVLASCGTDIFNRDFARPAQENQTLGIIHDFRLSIGSHQGKTYRLAGRNSLSDRLSIVVRNAFSSYSSAWGMEIWVYNQGDSPLTIYPEQFALVSPNGNRYTYDNETQWLYRVERLNERALSVSKTVQPKEQTTFQIFFRIGSENVASVMDNEWRLSYTSRPRGLFSSGQTIYLWPWMAYIEE